MPGSRPEVLVSVKRLQSLMAAGSCLVVDCRFDLMQPQKSQQDYREGHIPQAVYAHLNEHLSSEITPQTGRHPLPTSERFAAFLSSIGWHRSKAVIAYDAGNNAFSARLWWLMRYFGLPAALLDGGLSAWVREGLPLQVGTIQNQAGEAPKLTENHNLTVDAKDIMSRMGELILIDARSQERFSGATEPLDSKAGHIPGALNRPLGSNVDSQGQFKSPGQLHDEFSLLLEGIDAAEVVHYCGSGVTACHNALAMELAGFGASRIYPGSWSEWIRDSSHPVETSF